MTKKHAKLLVDRVNFTRIILWLSQKMEKKRRMLRKLSDAGIFRVNLYVDRVLIGTLDRI